MSIALSDLKMYGSEVMPDDDSINSIGGAVDYTTKVEFSNLQSPDTVRISSTEAADTTQTLTIIGRDNTGVQITETKTLNGFNVVSFTNTFERILKMTLSAPAAGTVSIVKTTGAVLLATMEPGILQIRRPFYNAEVPSTGTRKYYEKMFFKNGHGTLALTSAVISMVDSYSLIAFALESVLDGTDSGEVLGNRQTAPDGYTFTTADKNVVNSGNHTAGSVQGVWLELSLVSTSSAFNSSFVLTETGLTT